MHHHSNSSWMHFPSYLVFWLQPLMFVVDFGVCWILTHCTLVLLFASHHRKGELILSHPMPTLMDFNLNSLFSSLLMLTIVTWACWRSSLQTFTYNWWNWQRWCIWTRTIFQVSTILWMLLVNWREVSSQQKYSSSNNTEEFPWSFFFLENSPPLTLHLFTWPEVSGQTVWVKQS